VVRVEDNVQLKVGDGGALTLIFLLAGGNTAHVLTSLLRNSALSTTSLAWWVER
jgi:hypothetical protein